MEKKQCIFHIPIDLRGQKNSGSSVRPNKMIEAFQNIGYKVEIIMGDGKKRKQKIREIKKKIKKGEKYDFLYSESSNLPTLLTETHHFPRYPFLDFRFFRFCKKHNIKIGLFYRDVHWKFDHFKKGKSKYKLIIGEWFYKYDLWQYRKHLDVFYLPNKKMLPYIPISFNGEIEELPPGGSIPGRDLEPTNTRSRSNDNQLRIFYVGGLSSLYNLELLFKATQALDFVSLVVCCREEEWNKEKEKYEQYLNNRIKIVHEQGKELYSYFNQADILNLFVEPIPYWDVAIPLKLFEYISNQRPIIAVKNTAVGNFITKNKIGWTCEYSLKALQDLLSQLYSDKIDEKKEIHVKKANIKALKCNNTWEVRAHKVVADLK
ncbi:MAG TPA: glycosyltransferase [Candidatus Avamphibacillus sp.]|nr:glycosyltransferase [Candidatus Avamphibacillus sp.]